MSAIRLYVHFNFVFSAKHCTNIHIIHYTDKMERKRHSSSGCIQAKNGLYAACNKCAVYYVSLSLFPHTVHVRQCFISFSSHICFSFFFIILFNSLSILHAQSLVPAPVYVVRMHVRVHVKLLLLLCTRSAG